MIRNFEDKDIEEASKIAHLTWGNFYMQESQELQNLIYEFMVQYYDLNRKFSFAAIDNGFKGFLLAGCKVDKNNSYKDFIKQTQTLKNDTEREIALGLLDYLELCGSEVKKIMAEDDIMLCLFVSVQKGFGRELLAKLTETCIENGIKNIFLWSDTTCDYEYYSKNNFILVKEVKNILNGKPVTTVIYKKELSPKTFFV